MAQDEAEHLLFRRLNRERRRDTSTVTGTVVETDAAGERVKVQIATDLEPVWVRADGVTAIGQAVDVALGTDGRPLTSAAGGSLPEGAEPLYVGATGERILGQELKIDQTIQELEETRDALAAAEQSLADARAALEAADAALGQQVLANMAALEAAQSDLDTALATSAAARAGLPTLSASAPVAADGQGKPLGSMWYRTSGAQVIGVWEWTATGWQSRQMSGATLTQINAGSITTGLLAAARIDAAGVVADNARFIDAMMKNLSVTGVANLQTATADQLYAKLAVVQKLQATQGIITRDMIATGAITAEKIMATLELASKIARFLDLGAEQVVVGRDARFTPAGLVFYAPPAQGQDPTDWANRQPIIALTPAGDVSISVAEAGKITAGITPKGSIWGKQGRFDTLQVGGRDLSAIISDAPRGVIGVTQLAGNANLTSSDADVMGVAIQARKARHYKVTWFVGTGGSTPITVIPHLRHGSRDTQLRAVTVPAGQDATHTAIFSGDSSDFVDGESVRVTLTARGSGSVIGLGSWIMVEDIGPKVPVYGQTVSNPTPPVTWYGPQAFTGTGQGIRPDGSAAIDGRLTLGGYTRYGSDMAEYIWYPISGLGALGGSTVQSASIVLTITSNAPVAFAIDATGPSALAGRTNIFNGTAGSNGQYVAELNLANAQYLRNAGGLLIRPYGSGQYAYLDASITINAIWSK